MKKILALMAAALLIGSALAAAAAGGSPTKEQGQTAIAQEQPLRALEQRRLKALREGDATGLQQVLADDYVHVHSTGAVDDRAAFIKGVLARPRETVRGELRVRFYGELAVITGEQTNRFAGASGAPPTGATYFATQVARREPNGWRFVSMQNTPLQNIAAVPSATVSSYAPAPAVTMTAAQSEVAALEARRAAAIAARDFTALEGVLADDYLHVYGGGNSSDRAGYIAQVRAAARVPTRGPLTIRSYGDSAIITGDLLNRINYPEGERVLDTFVTQVVHKVDGQWKFVSFQITPKAH